LFPSPEIEIEVISTPQTKGMKQLVSFSLLALLGQSVYSQGCNEIFISEYVEGWSNNKAIELYNPTPNPINLSAYRLERYSNGATTAAANQKTDLSGTIEPYGTFVIVIDKRDSDGQGQEAPVWQELQDKADVFINPVYDENNTMYFNGNDAMVLRKIAGNAVLDVFGRIGEDPGNPNDGGGWNNVPPAFAWHLNGATAWSANHTLIRKSNVTAGYTTPTQPFNTGAQWDSLPANTFEFLGSHFCVCNPAHVSEMENLKLLNAFPNPSNGIIQLLSEKNIMSVQIMDISGREVVATRPGTTAARIETLLPPGSYVMKAMIMGHGIVTRKLVIE
jgi:hypothetical protein